MNVIVYEVGAIGCHVLFPAPSTDIADLQKLVPAGAASVTVDASTLPAVSPDSWVLANGAITVQVPTAKLDAYANQKQATFSASGLTVNVGTSSAPINVQADTTADGKANLSGILQGYSLGVLTGTYTWYQSTGSIQLTQAQLQSVSEAVLAFVAATFAAWQAVITAINASTPTITTTAQIDAYAWPAS